MTHDHIEQTAVRTVLRDGTHRITDGLSLGLLSLLKEVGPSDCLIVLGHARGILDQRQEHLYQLAFSAFVVGETEESILLLKMLLHDSPIEESSPIALEARTLLEKLEQEGDTTPSFLEWLWDRTKVLITGTA